MIGLSPSCAASNISPFGWASIFSGSMSKKASMATCKNGLEVIA